MNKTARQEKKLDKKSKESDLDRQLDDALKDTFPASDPISVGDVSVKPSGRADRPAAPINKDEVRRLAKKFDKKK